MNRGNVAGWAFAIALAGACGGGQQGDTTAQTTGQVPDRLAAGDGAGTDAAGDPISLGATRKARDRVPENAVVVQTVTPAKGFVDNPFAFNGAGGRLVYVNADAAELCEVVVLDLALGTEVMRLPITAFTSAPLSVADVIDGEHFLVMAHPTPDSPAISAAILDRTGKVGKTYGPATDVTRITYEGEDALVLYTRTENVPKKGKPQATHTVEIFALATGKRIGKKGTLVTDLAGASEKLDFRINHWAEGYTRAVGIKGGQYDKKEDQRSPDVEGWYDVPRATFSKKIPIADLTDHTTRFQVLAQHSNVPWFVMVQNELSGLVAYTGQAGPMPVELGESFRHYLPKSFTAQSPGVDGAVYFTLEIDPVHQEAVDRKHAAEKWIDLYKLTPGTTRAARIARLPIEDDFPGMTWRAREDVWAVLPHHLGFDRGGPRLIVYSTRPGAAPTVPAPTAPAPAPLGPPPAPVMTPAPSPK
ncbi:MAG TPA: hypothetical protein VMZ28_09455 [Kofleriaceae bacterium]|nr:hypothetical protein [Kofleriaceae bacterium]